MIPITLSVQNFLSYGESVPTLDFTGFHVACISGRNGHGKSALLDAITWAIWGEARKAGIERRPNEGLLRIGANEMRVDFEFYLEGDRYRVSRSFRKTARTGTTRLELQIYSPETGGYKTLSEEDSVRKTQDGLNNLLRMTYDTFINSAFLLQGRADEFTRRNARERKNILADILGLSHYDDLAGLARSHAQQAELDCATAQAKSEEIDAAVAQKKDIEKDLAAAVAQLEAAEEERDETEARLETLRATLTQRERAKSERDAAAAEIRRLEAECAETRGQLEAAQKDAEACREIIARKDEIKTNLETDQTLQKEEAELQARAHALRPLEQRANELERDIAKARHEVERRLGEWDLRVKDAERDIAEAEALLHDKEDIEARTEALRKAREQDRQWDALREQRDLIERTIRDLERRVESERADLQVARNTRREQLGSLETRASEIDARREALETARARLAELKALETERDRVRDRGSALNARIDTDRKRLETLHRTKTELEQQQTALQNVHDTRCPLCGSDLDEAHRAEVHTKLDEQLQSAQTESHTLETDVQTAETEREQLRRHYQELKNRLTEQDRAARTVAEAEAALQEAEKAVTETETLKRDIADLETRLDAIAKTSPDARALAGAIRERDAIKYNPAEHRTLRENLKDLETVETRRAQLQAAEERLKKARQLLPEHRQKRDLAKQWLDEARYAGKEQDALKTVRREIETLAYSAERHQQVSKERGRLKEAAARYERLQAAERELAATTERLQAAQTRLESLETQRKQAAERLSERDAVLAKGQSAEKEAEALRTALREARIRRDELLQKRVALQARHEHCLALETERQVVLEKRQTAEKDRRVYRELITAFGKDGIQALIIEQAIPEIEEEANRILARLSDNRTQIAIESLRDLKKGGTRETLDIKISDELGERSYELYSGGEAFRVDFAVRIALSKLLASRTGTRLRTLVIDEGFGTQDAQGLDNLVEAIQAISEDFEKILVITHVESLKQAFPVRIEVTKYPDQGSRFEVLY